METILVWVLVVSAYHHAEQFGPYADLESCRRVEYSLPMKNKTVQCVQVRVPRPADR